MSKQTPKPKPEEEIHDHADVPERDFDEFMKRLVRVPYPPKPKK